LAEAGGSRSRVADRSFSADLEGLTTEVKNVDMDTVASASRGSMEVDVDLNEGIKDEDLKVEALGEPMMSLLSMIILCASM
jgi:hypothetical protein